MVSVLQKLLQFSYCGGVLKKRQIIIIENNFQFYLS